MKADLQTPVFQETQRLTQWWLWAIIVPVAAFVWWGFFHQVVLGEPFGDRPGPDWVWWLLVGLIGVALPGLLLSCRLTVTVTDDHLGVAFFPFVRKRIAFADIEACEAVTYRPIMEYGGWGLRWRPGHGWAYTMSGNRGVRLKLFGGKELLLGSQYAEALAEAINARRGK